MFGFSSGNINYLIMLLKIISSSPTVCFPVELRVVVLGALVLFFCFQIWSRKILA